jgi:hypothetical protein
VRKIIGVLSAAFLLLNCISAFAEKPAGVVAEERTATATVEAVNKDTREVTLKGADGKFTFKAGPEVRNFAQIRVGDKVTATYYQELAVFVAPPGEAPSASETESLERAALGKKPGGNYTRTVNISATVEALDLKSRNITLRGPKGNKVTMKVGDLVTAEYTESIDITVSKP